MTGFPIPIPVNIVLKFDGVVDGQVKVPEHNGRVYAWVVLKNYMKISDSFNLFTMETWTYYWLVPNRVPMVLINGGDGCSEFFTHAESVYQLLLRIIIPGLLMGVRLQVAPFKAGASGKTQPIQGQTNGCYFKASIYL